jgi:hypothetical protein
MKEKGFDASRVMIMDLGEIVPIKSRVSKGSLKPGQAE